MFTSTFLLQRCLGYLAGFILFYEPFMLFGSLFAYIFPPTAFTSIHDPCARIPLVQLLAGQWQDISAASLFFCLLLAVSSLWLGPVFCGRMCPAGAFSEFLSSLLPDRYKISWEKYTAITPVRYGFLLGFLTASWLGIASVCAYCNYYALELFTGSLLTFTLPSFSLPLLTTFLLVNIVLGLFTKGGRGYCNFLCPVGAISSLLHILGRYVPGTIAMHINSHKCIGCGKCAAACPMRTITMDRGKAVINNSRCIICGSCSHICPRKAAVYQNNLHKELTENE